MLKVWTLLVFSLTGEVEQRTENLTWGACVEKAYVEALKGKEQRCIVKGG